MRLARTRHAPQRLCTALALACSLTACSGGGFDSGGSGSGTRSNETTIPDLRVTAFNLNPGQVVALNYVFEITFNVPVDTSTVNLNTLRISEGATGASAIGEFEFPSPAVVRFRPACPTQEDLSDAGLQTGTNYEFLIAGLDTSPFTVRSLQGAPILQSTLVPFSTPNSTDPAAVFRDTVPGPPGFLVRPAGSSDRAASYLELGLDPGARVYFERDVATGAISLPAGFLAPINPYSRIDERVTWILYLDQAIGLGQANLDRVAIQYFDSGTWRPLVVSTTLEANCTATGARIRVTPHGILPQRGRVRALLRAGFTDLTGDPLTTDDALIPAHVATSFDPGTQTPGADADEVLEEFIASGDHPGSLEDTTSGLPLPRARWGDGRLTAGSFVGTGGPGGDFDWYIPPGVTIVFDTTLMSIVGGPGGVPTTTQVVLNGVIDVRDLFLPASSQIVFIGPNPVTLLATGSVTIEGMISLRGGHSPGVGTLNTTNQPEPGANGNAGGGKGGAGSWLTSQSTPFGQTGFGAFDVPEGGGGGGEASFHPTNKNDRRGAGGGGGGHGPDVYYDYLATAVRCQTLIGMDGEAGRGGGPNGQGATSQPDRAMGGDLGPGPFSDDTDANDFFGALLYPNGDVVSGELVRPWAGGGGGGGGDAVRSDSFPLVPFNIGGDEKGAGAGGGAGSLHILAEGPVVVGSAGRIVADGGNGGGGENTTFFDRVGGGSGAGAGGSIVIESITSIAALGFAPGAGPFYTDNEFAPTHSQRSISALGGQGGAGHDNKGGANESGGTLWLCDSIPVSHFEGLPVPPSQQACFLGLIDLADPLGPVLGAGGDGAPGLIQLHVPDPSLLSFPQAFGQDVTPIFAPPPIGWENGSFAAYSRPSFGPRSLGQSIWIALGAARQDPGGGTNQVETFFDGIDPTGAVPHSGGVVTLAPPQLRRAAVQVAPSLPYIDTDMQTMVMDATQLTGLRDAFERNPNLVIGGTLRLRPLTATVPDRDYEIVAGSYDPALDTLSLTTSLASGTLTSYSPPGGVSAEWLFRSFRVVTGSSVDALDNAASIVFSFDATTADAAGQPDPAQSYSVQQGAWATDAALLNAADWDFYRFRVEFDTGGTVTPPAVDFLKLPFRF